MITDLGLYCGAGHATLTITSLKLLEILSTSQKLVSPPNSGMGRYSGRNKAIVALESNNDSDRIARSLANELLSDFELDEGPESDTYLIKVHILDFLNACLEAVPASRTCCLAFSVNLMALKSAMMGRTQKARLSSTQS